MQVYQTASIRGLLLGAVLALVMPAAVQARGATRAYAGPASGMAYAIFAGGCFWCMEPPFDETDGVLATYSGYTDGKVKAPSYEQVSAGGTGHTEGILVEYDPARVRYAELLKIYWRNVDPTDDGGQFCDRGSQYRAGIYPADDEQTRLAQASKQQLEASRRFPRVAVEIKPATTFWLAEAYHQDYYTRNTVRYKYYRYACGRDKRLNELWGTR